MNCRYSCDDGPWKKATIYSYAGGRQICIDSTGEGEFTLYNPEVLFGEQNISVTGYVHQPEKKFYKLMRIAVDFGKE